MLTATPVKNAIVIEGKYTCEGTTCLATRCNDYDHYKELPQVVQFEGEDYALTGWNSDNFRAYYQNNGSIAYAVLRVA